MSNSKKNNVMMDGVLAAVLQDFCDFGFRQECETTLAHCQTQCTLVFL